MWWLNRNKKSIFIFTLIILFCMPAVLSLFHPGFFQSDDGEWMIIRFSAFHEALRDGQIPVRFLSRLNYGYGYPVANFLYPGFMYFGEVFKLLGFGFVETIKIIFGVSMIGSAIFCFLWLSRFFDKLSSFIGALFYLYTPYHLFDLYKRGSIGEVLSLAIIPFILWQFERKSLFWSSIGTAFLIISHNTLAVLFLGLTIVYMGFDIYVSKGKKELLKKYFLMIMLGLGMSAFFWIPAFFELQYTVFSQTQVSNFNSYFANVDLIGSSTIFVLLLTAVFIITSIIKVKKHRLTLLLFMIGLVSVLFSSSLSMPLWKILPASFIQFPFRFLSITTVATAFLAACIVSTSPNKLKIPIAVFSLIILILSVKPFLVPSEFFDKGEGFYATNMDTTTVKNEYMPVWVKDAPKEHFKNKVEIANGEIKDLLIKTNRISFSTDSKTDTTVVINTIYFPGWKAYVDNKSVAISYANEKGVMDIPVPSGNHLVKATFTETPLRATSNTISLLSIFALLFLGIKSLRMPISV